MGALLGFQVRQVNAHKGMTERKRDEQELDIIPSKLATTRTNDILLQGRNGLALSSPMIHYTNLRS